MDRDRQKREKRKQEGKCGRCGRLHPDGYPYVNCTRCHKISAESTDHRRQREKEAREVESLNIKEMLIEYPYIPETVMGLNREINMILTTKHDTSVTQQLSGMPGSGKISNPTADAVERIIDRLDERVQNIGKRINDLLDSKELIDGRLKRLDAQERKIVELKYFRAMRWEEVRREARYSKSQSFEIHSKALKKLEVDERPD